MNTSFLIKASLSSLAIHYKSCGKRSLAYKYKVKAADQAISRGAFSDGLVFAQSAALLAVGKAELRVLLEVIKRALQDINPPTKNISHTARRLSKSFSSTNDFDQNSRIAAYTQLKLNTEMLLEKYSKPTKIESNIPGIPGSMANRTLMIRQPSARLTWQPSYVASKKRHNSSDDDDEDDSEFNPSKCCTIS